MLKLGKLAVFVAARHRSAANTTTQQLRRMISSTSSSNGANIDDVNAFRLRENQRDREQTAADDDATTGGIHTTTSSSSSSSHRQTGESAAAAQRVADVRNRILASALPFVPQLGWTRDAIEAGAHSLQLPSTVHGLFDNGGGFQLVQHFVDECDRRLVDEHLALLPPRPTPGVSMQLIEDAIRFRLELLEPVLSVWPQALGLRLLPTNAPVALQQLQRLSDEMCYRAGDRSTDSGWYALRIGVASLYKITELHLVQDSSAGHAETWSFLHRRCADFDRFGRTFNALPDAVRTVVGTVRNM